MRSVVVWTCVVEVIAGSVVLRCASHGWRLAEGFHWEVRLAEGFQWEMLMMVCLHEMCGRLDLSWEGYSW